MRQKLVTNPQGFFDEYRKGLYATKEEASSILEECSHFHGKVMSEGALSLKAKEMRDLAVSLEVTGVGVVRGGPAFTFLPLVHKTLGSLEKNKILYW